MRLLKPLNDAVGPEARKFLALTAAFIAATWISTVLRITTGGSAIFLPTGVMAGGFLLLKRRNWGPFAAVCLVAGAVETGVMAGEPGFRYYLYTLANFLEALVLAWLVSRLCGPRLDFSRWRQLALFGLIAVPLSAGVAVAAGALWGLFPLNSPIALLPFQSHALGSMLVVPAVLILGGTRRHGSFSFGAVELIGAIAGFSLLALGVFLADRNMPVLFLLIPMMMVLAFRYGPVGASLGVLAAALLSLHFSLMDPAAIFETIGMATPARIQFLQAFVAVLFFTALPVAGAVSASARMRALLARRTLVARLARSSAERASQSRAEFLANMSHEIRTPLNGVLGLADAMWRTDLKPEQRDMLKMILASGRALTALLSDALDLARADSGNMEIVREPFDIRHLIEEAALPFEHQAQAKGLEFEIRYSEAVPQASVGDPLRLRQILSNLISNAIKFTADGGVRLIVGAEGDWLRIAVRDTGIGLDEDMQSRLFRRFEQGDSSVTRRYGGCGLGLSIAYKLAEMMGGELACASDPGCGATFTLTLPLVDVATAPLPAAVPAGSLDVEHKLRVLLAEDHPVNRQVVQIILGDQVELTMVPDGQAAVEAMRVSAFDVVLMDTHMPVMDGLTAIRRIRDWERSTGRIRTPIVSLTADAMPQQIAAAMAAGADLHLSKPITGDCLARTLQASQNLDPTTAEAAKAG